jgi:predicted nucleic acid-binding protein
LSDLLAGYVVDASIAIQWLLPLDDEPHSDAALGVLRDSSAGRISLIAPEHLPYEIGHALRRAVRRGRVSEDRGGRLLEEFHAWGVPLIGERRLRSRAWDLSGIYGCSFYDATFLALSDLTGWPMLHADDRLRSTLRGRFLGERWIADYRSDDRPG